LWLAVAGPDVKRANDALDQSYLSELDEAGRRSATMVVDVTLPRRTCPACFTEYDAGPKRCPSCGLYLGA